MTPSIIVVMGPSGAGKSALGRVLAERLDASFLDGDDLHPPQNRARMTAGIPLTDADRWPWLDAVGIAAAKMATESKVVVACSALRRSYRERLEAASGRRIFFLFLDAEAALLRRRILERPGHFMPASLVQSQLETLEPPGTGEWSVRLDASASLEALADQAMRAIADADLHPASGGHG